MLKLDFTCVHVHVTRNCISYLYIAHSGRGSLGPGRQRHIAPKVISNLKTYGYPERQKRMARTAHNMQCIVQIFHERPDRHNTCYEMARARLCMYVCIYLCIVLQLCHINHTRLTGECSSNNIHIVSVVKVRTGRLPSRATATINHYGLIRTHTVMSDQMLRDALLIRLLCGTCVSKMLYNMIHIERILAC